MTDKAELEALAERLSEAAALPNGLYAEASTAIRALLAENKRLREALVRIDSLDPQCAMDTLARAAVNGLVVRMGANARQALQETDNAG